VKTNDGKEVSCHNQIFWFSLTLIFISSRRQL